MLVCNVSQLHRRAAIAADVAEAAAAADAPGTGNVVFATLVDDPANVRDTINAFLGEIMLEAAAAGDTISGSVGAIISAVVAESATAASTQNGSVTAPTVTWDAATVTAVTLSGGNLVATNTGTTSADQGARVATASGKTSGKYYFEVTITTLTGGGNRGVGIGTTASTYTNMGNSATTGVVQYISGGVWANGSSSFTWAPWAAGNVMKFAVDLDNRKFWVRGTGIWNNNASADPATNVGGVTIPSGTMVPFCIFGGSSGTASNVFTANFGASGFSSAAPSGFTSGWPA